jgi:hypothetical protein
MKRLLAWVLRRFAREGYDETYRIGSFAMWRRFRRDRNGRSGDEN